MGAGQPCTNPARLRPGRRGSRPALRLGAAAAIRTCEPWPMLTPGIARAIKRGVGAMADHDQVLTAARGRGAMASIRVSRPVRDRRERFLGPTRAALMRYSDRRRSSSGSLTSKRSRPSRRDSRASGPRRCMEPPKPSLVRRLIPMLERKSRTGCRQRLADRGRGRVRDGAWRTISRHLRHRSTSVGARAIGRFLRPVCSRRSSSRESLAGGVA